MAWNPSGGWCPAGAVASHGLSHSTLLRPNLAPASGVTVADRPQSDAPVGRA